MLLVSQEIIQVLRETLVSLDHPDLTGSLEFEDLTGNQANVDIQVNQDDVHVVECQDNRQYVSGLNPKIIINMSGYAFLLCKSKSAIPVVCKVMQSIFMPEL